MENRDQVVSQSEIQANKGIVSTLHRFKRSASLLAAAGLAGVSAFLSGSVQAEPVPTVPIDIYVENGYKTVTEIQDWAQDSVVPFSNNKLATFGINRRITLGEVQAVEVGQDCTIIRQSVDYTGQNKIALFLSQNPETYNWTWFAPHTICMSPDVFSWNYTEVLGLTNGLDLLLHEFGHQFGLPDKYLQDVYPYNNRVVNIGITPNDKDIMWIETEKYAFFSSNSVWILNNTETILPGHVEDWKKYTPKNTILKVIGEHGLPLPDTKVEVFPMKMQWWSGNKYPINVIDNKATQEMVTDNTGRVFLGGYRDIFMNPNLEFNYGSNLWEDYGNSALIRVTHGQDVRYAALTLTELNDLYIRRGQTNFATIELPFRLLVKAPSNGEWVNIRKLYQSEQYDQSLAQNRFREAHRSINATFR